MSCKRCGIDINYAGLCDDCADVTGQNEPRSFLVAKKSRGYQVRCTRKVGTRIENRAALMKRTQQLTARGLSTNAIALELGVSDRTIVRWRRARKAAA